MQSHQYNIFLVPRICFAEEVLKEYQRFRGPPDLRASGWGAEKPVKPVFTQWLSQSYAPSSGRNGNNSKNLKHGARSAIFIELLNMTHDETKWAIKFSGGEVLQAQSAQRFAIFFLSVCPQILGNPFFW